MTISQFLYAVTLALLGGALTYTAGTMRRERIGLVLFFQLSFWLRAAAVFVNEQIVAFPQKFAACFPLDMINRQGGLLGFFQSFDAGNRRITDQLKFVLEAAANIPGIALFENSPVILNLTNCLVGALAGIVVFAYMRRLFGRNIAIFALLLVSFFPAAFNFSLFGLRDIFLYFLILANIASLLWLLLRPERRMLQIAIYAVSLLALGLLRSALLPLILILPAFLLGRYALRHYRTVQDRRTRIGLVAAAILTGALVLAGSYVVVLHHVGINGFVTPDRLFAHYVEARASRGTPFAKQYNSGRGAISTCRSMNHRAQNAARGVASQYIPFERYRRTPWVLREALQLVGFIVIPLPWQLDRLSRVLALFDTIFVIATMLAAWKALRLPAPPSVVARRREDMLRQFSLGLLLSFAIGWLGYGLLVTDSGNAFRLRLSVEPFLLFATSFYLAAWPWANDRLERLMSRLG
jgi:hypothetical protein